MRGVHRAALAALILVGIGAASPALCVEQIWGEFVYYFGGDLLTTANTESYAETALLLNFDASDRSSVFLAAEHEEGDVEVDEAFVDADLGTLNVRAGKFRKSFGIYSRAETEYMGFLDLPLVKDNAVNGLLLSGSETGMRLERRNPRLDIQLSILSSDEDAPIFAGRNNLLARAQTYSGDLILGASRYQGGTADTGRFGVWGLDWRHSRPYIIVRGELVTGSAGPQRMHGGYADAFYHFPSIPKLTALARMESLTGDVSTHALTLGGKYRMSRQMTVFVNWRRTSTGGNVDSSLGYELLIMERF